MSLAPLPRLAARPLREALMDSPVVLIHGPRQCGKSTLARSVCRPLGYDYLTFDDDGLRDAAVRQPGDFVSRLGSRVVLDEIQRVPELFTALKKAVDEDRRPGRFVLTGSANVLLLPRLADSLAGRMAILRLHPLAQVELARAKPWVTGALFGDGFRVKRRPRLGPELAKRIAAGGYPAAVKRPDARRRADWCRDYVAAIVDRDVRDLTRIAALDAIPRLLELAAGQTARLSNVTELAAPFHVSRPTIRDYVTLLSRLFLVEELPAWSPNRMSRAVRTPKLHLGDTGLAAALLGATPAALWRDRELLGQLLETFVLQELRRQATGYEGAQSFHHFRDKDGYEVDIVIERGPLALVGVEVKASASVSEADFRGLRRLRTVAGARFKAGVVLYDGEVSTSFGDDFYAVPLRFLWEPG